MSMILRIRQTGWKGKTVLGIRLGVTQTAGGSCNWSRYIWRLWLVAAVQGLLPCLLPQTMSAGSRNACKPSGQYNVLVVSALLSFLGLTHRMELPFF